MIEIILFFLLSLTTAIPAIITKHYALEKRSNLPSPALLSKFQTYMRFASAAMCEELINEQVFPLGSDWDKLHPSKLIKSVFAKNTTGAAYLAVNDELQSIIIGFRGSATKQLWIEDFLIWGQSSLIVPVPPLIINNFRKVLVTNPQAKDALIHFGFQQTYMEGLQDPIQTALNQTVKDYPNYKIVFVGHSLGAALTQLAAVDFFLNCKETVSIFICCVRGSSYSFADSLFSPRIGNDAWSLFIDSLPFSKNAYRLVRYGDIVPHLPPMFLSYHHSFQQYSILPDNQVISCNQYKPLETKDCDYSDFYDIVAETLHSGNQHPDTQYLKFLNQTFDCTRRGYFN